MQKYTLKISNIWNEDYEIVEGRCWDECFRLSEPVAEKMLEELKNEYADEVEVYTENFTIEDDIIFEEL